MTVPSVSFTPSSSSSEAAVAARRERTRELFDLAAATSDPERAAGLLDEIAVINIPIADALASRYRRRGVDDDDLSAVARLALVKAVRRFDVNAGHDFASFASPTIRGEIKRYFRDNGWMVRPPRRIQEMQAAIASAQRELSLKLGHSPRPSDLAAALDADISDVEEAMSARGCFTPSSIDLPLGPSSDRTISDMLVHDDSSHEAAEARAMLGPLVRRLDARDRHIVELRFFHGLTQSEIAADIGVTQMQVSRLLARILRDLRQGLGDDVSSTPRRKSA